MKTFYIRTYGCQMNELDSENLSGILLKRGLEKTDNEKNADLIIFNTCSVRDLAERKIFGKLGIISRRQKKAIIGIAGCIASSKKEAILKKFPIVDFVLGTNNIFDLDDVLDDVISRKKRVTKVSSAKKEYDHTITKRKSKVKAFVSIIKGCNNFCSYCIVPYTRGREISKDPNEIIKECLHLRDQGYKEINLLGQNVNSYGLDMPSKNIKFPDLLAKIDNIDGIERIRFLTSHPKDISNDLMRAIADLESVCESIHLPVQSGSSRVLKMMNRRYTKEDYLEKIELLKKIVPKISIGTDVIVGFPGEEEKDFLETVDLFKKIKFSPAFIFAYSKRKGTPAADLQEVPINIKTKRLQHLLEVYKDISKKEYEKLLLKKEEILVESMSKRGSHFMGRTRCNKKVLVASTQDLIGKKVVVTIREYKNETFIASL